MHALAAVGLAAQLASARPELAPTRVAKGPVLDGVLDDAAWAAATPATTFTQKFPNERAAPAEPTTLRVVYDDEALYVAFDCEQRAAPIVARMARRDREIEADNVSIAIDSRAQGRTAFEFVVNAAGVLRDGIRANDVVDDDESRFSAKWDENWDARARPRDGGWTAEIRIPFRVLRFSSAAVQTWGFQARRYVSARQETDEWAFIPRSQKSEVPFYGRLLALRVRPRSELEVRPFVLGRLRRRDRTAGTLAEGVDGAASAGLDLRWHVTPDLTLDATFNPDFTGVEGDELFLNLMNVESFFPEKRPFFVEGSEVFESPTQLWFTRSFQLLYTRRIGRVAPAPPTRPGERLVDLPAPATILGASKLVGRLGQGWSVGAMSALTAESAVDVENAAAERASRVADPTTAWHAIRVKHDFSGGNAHVGLLATSVQRAGTTRRAPIVLGDDGLPRTACPGGATAAIGERCLPDAYAGGIDGLWRSADGERFVSAQVVASTLRDGAPRTLRDGTVIRSGDAGWGAQAMAARDGGAGLAWNLQYQYASRKLDTNDLGYQPRQNQHYYYAGLEHRTFAPVWFTVEARSFLEMFGRAAPSGLTLQRRWLVDELVRTSGFWTFYVEGHWDEQRFDDRETGDGTPLERDGRPGGALEVASDRRKSVFVRARAFAQRPPSGFLGEANVQTLIRAHPQLDLEVVVTGSHTTGEPRFAGRATDGEARFADLRATSLATTFRGSLSVTPRLALQAFTQLYLAAGHYGGGFRAWRPGPAAIPDGRVRISELAPATPPLEAPDFEDASLSVNVVARWEYTIGSVLYLVYARSQAAPGALVAGEAVLGLGPLGRAPAADVWLLKWQVFATL